MQAIISDIHSNLEALVAVLDDINTFSGVNQTICLGDIVGYGPDPCECIDLIMNSCDVVLLGNHDLGALFDPQGLDSGTERAIVWTRAQLENDCGPNAESRWEFLGERPRSHKEGDCLFVHGSARNPLNEYVFPEDIYNPRKMESIFEMVDKYCFQGHTHVPGVFTEDLHFYAPPEFDFTYHLDGNKTLINVGSVGQPRDGDPRACYVMLDSDKITFRRVDYNAQSTADKIRRMK